jgi:hypothetical protein
VLLLLHGERQRVAETEADVSQREPPSKGSKARVVMIVAAQTNTPLLKQTKTKTKPHTPQLDLPKPLGLRFARGNDGGAYVIKSDPNLGSTDPRVEPGDKIVQISASFGADIWDAQNFGQIMYAIRTRSGNVYLKIKRNFGDMSALEDEDMDEAEKRWRAERRGGNYGAGTKEMQARNYVARKEAERQRRELFDDALDKFKAGDVSAALVDFENVASLEVGLVCQRGWGGEVGEGCVGWGG